MDGACLRNISEVISMKREGRQKKKPSIKNSPHSRNRIVYATHSIVIKDLSCSCPPLKFIKRLFATINAPTPFFKVACFPVPSYPLGSTHKTRHVTMTTRERPHWPHPPHGDGFWRKANFANDHQCRGNCYPSPTLLGVGCLCCSGNLYCVNIARRGLVGGVK